MLWISSMMMTVLPTPAPPKRPTFPPLEYGSSRSTTLMPVSSTSVFVSTCGAMNGQRLLGLDRPLAVDRLAQHVEQTAERLAADRHRDGRAGVDDLHPADQSVGAGHGDGAHAVLTQVLGHLQCEADLRTAGLLILRRLDSQRVIDLRQFPFGKFRIHDRSDHLDDSSLRHCALRYFSASAPPTMSINSLVMAACRAF